MPQVKLFIGSSSAARSQAKAIVTALSSNVVSFLPWWDAFTPGRNLLEELDTIRSQVQGAILLFSPESETEIKGQKKMIPNLNVMFEFGYFYGHFGKEKVAMMKYGDFFLPSDFGGYLWITGSTHFTRGGVVAVGKRTQNDFSKWIQKV